ncbi:helix-turn-helix domain-containing protein [Sporosarcina sp. ACRSL]|uniref:helix-turn-helix domain-containing protein n=1 Tax=Sporosarcina sp. ACRSL TaxID=2918215 RepID=UPI001EF45001|nr:helix-turn-helix transcriptional regulator [Sporosarcina sp. ACRSL]MCG7343417.1 helix-turn-helix domain-containing protein [Sporosarcina sp. ACRSL]
MSFGEKLKRERELKGWSQEELATKIHVSRQSVSKWETGKNYPSIEVIIDLSDLFGITIDELLRSDGELKEKIIQDSKQSPHWTTSVLFGFGALLGIIIVSTIRHGEMNWTNIGGTVALSTFAIIFIYMISKGVKKSGTKK